MKSRRLLIGAALALSALGVAAPMLLDGTDAARSGHRSDSQEPNRNPAPLGVYRGAGRLDRVQEFETWLGHEVRYVLDFVGRAPRGDKQPWQGIEDPSHRCAPWAGGRHELVLSVAMVPNDRFTLARGAAGDYDTHWRKFAKSMIESGCADAILRLGWEFNGRFFPWAAGGREQDFVRYWRRIVSILRSVPGQEFRYDWSVLAGGEGADVEAAYPGDDVVDFIGLDAYDTSRFTDEAERRSDQETRAYGLAWHADFADERGKPMSFPEWGLTVRRVDELGGGDSPSYIEAMLAWIADHNIAYALYFDFDAQDASHRISSARFPRSSKVFRESAGDLAIAQP